MAKSQILAPSRVSKIAAPDFVLPGRKRAAGPQFSPVFLLPLIVLALLLTASQPATAGNQYKPTQQPYIINDLVYRPLPSATGYKETGIASWYGPDFNGHPTSNGEVYDMYEQTAAHKLLPMNTMLLVSNLENGKTTIVRVNDRGPFVQGRIIDLSYTAAEKLDLVDNGTARVQVTTLGKDDDSSAHATGADINYNLGEFYIQIGAFGQKNNAVKLQKRFSDSGHATIIQEFFSQESIFYRVCVYAGRELRGAYKVEDALHNHGWRGAFVVAR